VYQLAGPVALLHAEPAMQRISGYAAEGLKISANSNTFNCTCVQHTETCICMHIQS